MLQIQIPSGFASSQTLSLDGVLFTLELRWNSRAQAWSMDLYDAASNLLAGGLRLVADTPLLERFGKRDDFPAGDFIAFDSSAQGLDPGYEDLGTRVSLLYVTAEEVAAA
jgi:hypothetical protein